MRTRALLIALAFFSSPLGAEQPVLHGGAIDDLRDAVVPSDRLRINQAIAVHAATLSPSALELPPLYPILPLSGTVGRDLVLNNTVDLDPSPGVLDFDCTGYSYNGHRGHDILLVSFRQQAVGVPIFAALDGTVVDTHDGEPDMNTTQNNVPANFVVLHHGGTHYTFYYHMRNGSVAVVKNQTVTAGTQLGLTASSGFSDWPHLHFESQVAGAAYEPSAGPCRPGASYWVQQPAIRRDPFAWDFSFGTAAYDLYPTVPHDDGARVGTYVRGNRPIYFKAMIPNLPAGAVYALRVIQPDGSSELTYSGSFNNPVPYRNSWWWWSWPLTLDPPGQWRVEIDVNGNNLVSAPFDVVTSTAEIADRAPNAVSVRIEPSCPTDSDVLFCRVTSSLVTEDPDYDVLGYRYSWTIGGVTVREATSAGFSDVLAKGSLRRGDVVSCSVTPNDGSLDGPTAVAQVKVKDELPVRRRAVRQ